MGGMGAVNGTVTLGSTCMDYISFGRGTRPLVIIPGLGDGLVTVKGKAAMGGVMFRDFAQNDRVWMFSRKRQLEPDASTRSMAWDLAEAMGKLELERVDLVGVSQGGMIAQYLAAEHPELVEKLVLVVTVPAVNETLRGNVLRWKMMAQRKDFKALMVDITEMAHPEYYLKKRRITYPLMGLMGRNPDFERFRIQADACLNHDAREVLGRITAPTLIIGGGEDKTLGFEGSRQLHEAIPGSKLLCYRHHGHALYEDARDFNQRVLSWFSGAQRTGEGVIF